MSTRRCKHCNAVVSGNHECGEVKPVKKKRTKQHVAVIPAQQYAYTVERSAARAKARAKTYNPDDNTPEPGTTNYVTLHKRGDEHKRKGLRDVDSFTIQTATGARYIIELVLIDGVDGMRIIKKGAENDTVIINPEISNVITIR